MTETTDENGTTGADSVEVRRNVPLAAAVGTIAGLLAIAFAVRALGGDGGALDWLALGVLVLITIAYAATLLDSRAPLMVVDDRGVRLREGGQWKGVAWDDVECMEHLPRRLPLHDGHLLMVGYDEGQLVVPLTMATRVVGATDTTLSDTLAELAAGRADVVEVVPGIDDEAPGEGPTDVPTDAPAEPYDDRSAFEPPAPVSEDTVDLTEVSTPPVEAEPVESTESTESTESPESADDVATGEIPAVPETEAAPETEREQMAADVAPGRTTILAARVDLDGTPRPRAAASVAPEAPETPSATERAEDLPPEEATVVLGDLAVRPAASPVIGPQLASARERLRLSIDQLSERTRIRPHVIEAIESDDFAACGGDFYARGHLRTLSRVLGIDAAPLVATYDDTYADVPVDPRRVFESELATGHGGSIRSTNGGRNWSVLISAVMGAILVWSVARLALGGPAPAEHAPELNQSGGITHFAGAKSDPVKVVLNAAHGGAHVVVRDARGRVVFDGPLAFGQTANLKALAPVRIQTSDGSVTSSVDGRPAKPLGKTGEEASGTFVAR